VKRGDEVIGSPQSFLDTIRPPDLLDPLAFSGMPPAERRTLMIRVAGLGEELAKAEEMIEAAEAARLSAGREARSAAAAFKELPDAPKGTPDEKVSASALLAELQELQRQHQELKAAQTLVEKTQDTLERASSKVLAAAKALALAEAEEEAAATGYKKAVDQRAALPVPSEERGETLKVQIDGADYVNANVERKLQKAAAKDRMRVTEQKHAAAESTVESARAARDVLIDKAELPLEGLGFDDADATFNGVRWASLGTAEQLRIGLALGAAQHPGLPVFVIHRGESLDAEALRVLNEWAQEEGVQVLMEVVGGEGNEGAYVIEAGKLK
jgi:hypothetical protein